MTEERDLYRDTPVRYLGYANELGESFRPLIDSSLVKASYAISIAYACADTFDKTKKKREKGFGMREQTITAVDVLLWQMLASVIVPGFTINRITWISQRILKTMNASKKVVKIVPTAVGLGSIPLIVHPIDSLITYMMDNTFRKWIN